MYIKGRDLRLDKNGRAKDKLPKKTNLNIKRQIDEKEKYGKRYSMLE